MVCGINYKNLERTEIFNLERKATFSLPQKKESGIELPFTLNRESTLFTKKVEETDSPLAKLIAKFV